MTIHTFYLYQLAWYVFGTLSAFLAAYLFWNKGASSVDGRDPALGMGLKLTGAGGIFVAVLLVVHVINPLKPLSDYNRLLILYSDQVEAAELGGSEFTIRQSEIGDLGFDPDTMMVEMIPFAHIHSLAPELDGRSFSTPEPIPSGRYKIRFSDSATGEVHDFMVRVP